MGSTYHAYAHFHEVTDENGEVLKDEEGMYVFEYTVNGETVSEMDYAEFLKQYDSEKIIVLNSASTNDNSDYEYHTPEEMLDLLSE